MVIDMNETELKTVAQLRAFLNGTLAVEFQPLGEGGPRYAHIAAVLRRLGYRRRKRREKGWCCAILNAPPATRANS
jgi:hypothetical protein